MRISPAAVQPITQPEGCHPLWPAERLRRDVAGQGAENARLRQDNPELRAKNVALESELADLKAQVAGLAAKGAWRDQAGERRDSQLAALRWSDIWQEDRLGAIEGSN